MTDTIWTPSAPQQSQMWHFMQFAAKKNNQQWTDYQELHHWSITYPAEFWSTLVDYFSLSFDKPPIEILNHYSEMSDAQWFSGAKLNFAQQLLKRQDEHPALISLNERNDKVTLTYKELYLQVAQCAAGLRAIGIQAGDRVAALLPNTTYTIIAMLATTSLGAIWSSCSPDFGAQAAIDRLGQINPKILFISDGHQYAGKYHSEAEKIQQLSQAITSLNHVVICPNQDRLIDLNLFNNTSYWQDFIKPATKCEFVSLPFNHPIYILYSSGTTGKPKCIIHGAGGTLLQHLKELGLHTDLKPSDNLLFYTTCGWMMWNWMVSALALGTTLTLYEGSPTYPNPERLFDIIEQEQVTVFGTSAKYISTIEKEQVSPQKKHNLSALRCILSTGSPLLPKNYDYVYQQIKSNIQLSSISGGTDIVSCFALGNPILPIYKGELQCSGLGMSMAIFDEQGKAITGARGELVCTKPFPSMPIGFWGDPERKAYKKAYFERFPSVWAHGDFAEMTSHGGLIIYGRSDAVLNPGGVRIGTAEIYRQVEKIDEVLDSVVVGQEWHDDIRIVLFVKLRENITLDEKLITKIKQVLKENASPRHVPAKIIQVKDIPRTISGKTVELAVRQVIHNQPVCNLQSLANPMALEYFKNKKELLY
ncbi:MAG: acetoacetate--CoA ligase [Legionella sp.]|nr:MAG: acetoacetate--CoA ligase [Legionella sp.]PJD98663.1 MAG: acetoacetate--CoA ligase [Legionella sp.]